MVSYENVVNRLEMLGYTVLLDDKSSIEYTMKSILNYVVNYCNLLSTDDIPIVLDNRIIDRICGEFLFYKKNTGQLVDFDYDVAIKIIDEGDTKIQFNAGEGAPTPESRFDRFLNYMERGFDKWCAPHRKIKWII